MNTSLPEKDQLNNYVFGLIGEVGEVLDLLKKFFFHGHEVDSERLKSELWRHSLVRLGSESYSVQSRPSGSRAGEHREAGEEIPGRVLK